jgi:hypothetical protein
MRRLRRGTLALLLIAAPAFAGDPKTCLDLSARMDNDVSSPSGIRVIVSGRNRCTEDLDSSEARFKVIAVGSGGAFIATQSGRFGGTVAAHGHVETLVFVSCDPERVRSVRVEGR